MSDRIRTIEQYELLAYGERPYDLAKADANITSSTSGYFNPIYGALAWAQLNFEAHLFSVFPKTVWTRSGWRMITAAGTLAESNNHYTNLGGTAEEGKIAETIKPTVVEVSVKPKIAQVAFGASTVSEFLANNTDDDAWGGLAQLRTFYSMYHKVLVNKMISVDTETVSAAAANDAAYGGTFNFESIDRIISSSAEEAAVGKHASQSDFFDAWDTIDRDTTTSYDAIVQSASGTLGTNEVLTKSTIREWLAEFMDTGGAHPEVLVTGNDVYTTLQEMYEAQSRLTMGEHVVSFDVNGISTFSGHGVGLHVASLYGVPLLYTQEAISATGDTDEVGRIYGLDLTDKDGHGEPRFGFSVARPTTYHEIGPGQGGWPWTAGKFGEKGLYYTMGELLCRRFTGQGKLRDIKV